jgi:hypothetical protein
MIQHSAAVPLGVAPRWKVLHSAPGSCAFGVWQNLFIGVWEKAGTGETVRALVRASDGLTGTHSAIHVIHDGAGLPTPEGRAALVELLQHRSGKVACLAVVLLGHGFWASALQSAVTGIRLMVPKAGTKLRIFEGLEDAGTWLSEEHGVLTGVVLDPIVLGMVLKNAVVRGADRSGPTR